MDRKLAKNMNMNTEYAFCNPILLQPSRSRDSGLITKYFPHPKKQELNFLINLMIINCDNNLERSYHLVLHCWQTSN